MPPASTSPARTPFAAYHTPIAGNTKGRLSVVGYLGLVVGLLMITGTCAMLVSGIVSGLGVGGPDAGAQAIVFTFLMGWASRLAAIYRPGDRNLPLCSSPDVSPRI